MKYPLRLLCLGILASSNISSISTAAVIKSELNPKVQAALDWQLPENSCIKPNLTGDSAAIVDSLGVTSSYHVDGYKLGRHKRKLKRWQKCAKSYRKDLMADFENLKSSAQYGLTQDQAKQILGKMALIQTALRDQTETNN